MPQKRVVTHRWTGRLLLLVLLSLLSMGGPFLHWEGPVSAQAPNPDPEPEPPIILEQTPLADGGVLTNVQIPPAADTYIADNYPTLSFGSEPALMLGYDLNDAGAERILLRFAVLSAVPPNANVLAATLRLHPIGDEDFMGTNLRRLDSPWDEGSVSWNTEPQWGPVYASPGQLVGGVYEWDITQLVQEWVDGDHTNYGMEIIGDERVQQRERAFYASEADTVSRPHLEVEYVVSDDRDPPNVTLDPLDEYSDRQFEVTWSGSDVGESGIAYYNIHYRIDGGAWGVWISEAQFTSATYTGSHGHLYEFCASGVDNAGNVEPCDDVEAATTVDIMPPVSVVAPLPTFAGTDTFTVSWSGTDEVSGIAYYDVYYRIGTGPWVEWIPQTVATSSQMIAGSEGVYQFEVRAVDNRGLVEVLTGNAEASTIVDLEAPFVVPQAWLPIVLQGFTTR